MIPEFWDRAPCWAPCSVGSLLLSLPLPFPLLLLPGEQGACQGLDPRSPEPWLELEGRSLTDWATQVLLFRWFLMPVPLQIWEALKLPLKVVVRKALIEVVAWGWDPKNELETVLGIAEERAKKELSEEKNVKCRGPTVGEKAGCALEIGRGQGK